MSGTDAPDDTAPALGPPRPRLLLPLVTVAALEAVAFAVFAGAVVVELVVGESSNVGVSVFVAAFFAGLAWALVACARALWQGRRSGRSIIAGWQVFQVIIGIGLLTSGVGWAVATGVLVAAVGAFALVGLMTRKVVEYTTG